VIYKLTDDLKRIIVEEKAGSRGLKKKTKCINQEYQSLKGRFKAIRHVATVKEILVILLNIVTLNFSMFT
jgi:hypothetical protein